VFVGKATRWFQAHVKHVPPALQETQLRVRNDAYLLGDRCTKKKCTKGLCDLCHVFLNRRTPETLRHILKDCPFTTPVLTTVWRTYFFPRADPTTNASTANLSSSDLINRYERHFLLGTAAFDSPPPPRQLNTPIATISAATNTCLMRRRNHNAYNPTLPLQHNTPRLVADILQLVAQTATAMRTTAQLKDRYIYTHHEGWMPPDEDDWPTNVWKSQWCNTNLLRNTHPQTQPAFTLPSPLVRIEDHPTYDPEAADVRSRATTNRG